MASAGYNPTVPLEAPTTTKEDAEELPMKHLFVSELDTQLGRHIVEKFGKTHEYRIVGTLRSDPIRAGLTPEEAASVQQPLPPWVSAIIPSYLSDNAEFKRQVLAADVIVLPMRDSTVEAMAAVRMLTNASFDVEKTLVVVSSVLTWADTYKAQKAEERAARLAERQAAIDAGEEVDDDPAEDDQPEEPPVFGEDSYAKRVPSPRYQLFKEVEHAAKVANSGTLHTYVVFAGLHYGAGEDMLEPFFRKAWHLQPLPMHTDGTNVVPMIHVDDLANVVFKLGTYLDVLPQRYILGVDRGNVTWGAAIAALNTAMGTGATVAEPRIGSLAYADWITIDIRLEGSTISELIDESEWVAADGFVASIDKVVSEYKQATGLRPLRLTIQGPPRAGKTTLATLLAEEYRVRRLGPSDIIREYAEYRRELEQRIAEHRKRRIRERREAAKREAERAAREEAELAKEQQAEAGEDSGVADASNADSSNVAALTAATTGHDKENEDEFAISFDIEAPPQEEHSAPTIEGEAPAEAEPEEEAPAEGHFIDPAANDDEDDELLNKLKEDLSQVNRTLAARHKGGRLVDEAMAVMGRRALTTPASRNQGYVLDGFPATIKQAVAMFGLAEITLPDPEEDDGSEPLDATTALAAVDGNLLVEHVIEVTCAEHVITTRAVPGDSDPHNSLAAVYRRLRKYKENNPPSRKPFSSLAGWFSAILTNDEGLPRAVSTLGVDMGGPSVRNVEESVIVQARLQECRHFLGPPRYVHPTPEDIEQERHAAELKAEEVRLVALRAEEARRAEEAAAHAAEERQRQNDDRRQSSLRSEREAAAVITGMPMNEYLNAFVIQALTDAVTHVAHLRPDDPVNSLADFLFEFVPREKLDAPPRIGSDAAMPAAYS